MLLLNRWFVVLALLRLIVAPASAQSVGPLASPARLSAEGFPRVVLRGDYPDPSILRVGQDYYMTHSAFAYAPGFLIWHSTDLLHWEPVTRVLTKFVGSVYAPDLVRVGKRFYIYFPAAGANWVIWAERIEGPWSEPIKLEAGKIDPGHAVGEDGKRYLFLSAGMRVPLSPDGLRVTGPLEKVYAGWDYPKDWKVAGRWLEGPKILRKGDYFYLISAEGGTDGPPTSHMVIAARSKSIKGPWENSPYNPIVHTYSAAEPWWSKGHGTLVDDVQGNWWIVYHAYQNGFNTLGRQTLLEPIEWLPDGWFRLATKATPIAPKIAPGAGGMPLSDEFTGPKLGRQWTSWREYNPRAITLREGALTLAAKGTSPADTRLLLVTATDARYEVQVEVTVEKGSAGGLVLFYNEQAFAGLSSNGSEWTVYESGGRSKRAPGALGLHFYVKIVNDRNTCALLASADGKAWTTLQSGLDVSQMDHHHFGGFLALRPALIAAGRGEVKFQHFIYRALGAR